MHVLVIGGNRFVGRLLVWRLLARGDTVTTFNRGQLSDPFGARIERLVGDRTGPDFERLLGGRRFDAVVDLAAFTESDGRRAVEVLQGRVGHLVMVSTGQVYLVRQGCARPMVTPAVEDDFAGPVMARPSDPADVDQWEYGVGKRQCEEVLALAWEGGFPATRVRLPMVNGPLDYQRRLESYLWRLLDGGPVLLPDGGAPCTRHVDAGEAARFLGDVLGREESFGQAYNLAQEELPSVAEVVEKLKGLVGSRAPVLAVPRELLVEEGLSPRQVSPFDGQWMSLLDPGRAQRELGFRHAPLDACLRATVASFLAHPPADRPPGWELRAREWTVATR